MEIKMKLLLQISLLFVIFSNISGSSPSIDFLDCPKNMQVSFSDEKNSTEAFCDCKDTFWYNPEDDFCYDGYRQGPCPSGHYFVLPPGELIAKCEKNPCGIDGLVPFKGNCYQLWDFGLPCDGDTPTLGINDDFQIACVTKSYPGSFLDWRVSKSCPENSLLKAINEEHNSYFCECKTTHINSQKDNSCHQAYRQGPCASGNYFTLPPGETEPRCERNPCKKDGLVPFQNGCHKIYETGPPCEDYLELTVTKDTFQLICNQPIFPLVGAGGIINAPTKACPAGSRRIFTGCKKQFH